MFQVERITNQCKDPEGEHLRTSKETWCGWEERQGRVAGDEDGGGGSVWGSAGHCEDLGLYFEPLQSVGQTVMFSELFGRTVESSL